jgi:hypothetical protein
VTRLIQFRRPYCTTGLCAMRVTGPRVSIGLPTIKTSQHFAARHYSLTSSHENTLTAMANLWYARQAVCFPSELCHLHGRLIAEVSRPHTGTHTPGRTPLNKWSARRRVRYLHYTQQTLETNIQALGGIETGDPSNRAASDLQRTATGIGYKV